jgi:bifunctional non-homologous end joining protein LigD
MKVGNAGCVRKKTDAAYLKKTLDQLKTRTPVVPVKGNNYAFAQPTLIAEMEFRDWNDDGNLRQAS